MILRAIVRKYPHAALKDSGGSRIRHSAGAALKGGAIWGLGVFWFSARRLVAAPSFSIGPTAPAAAWYPAAGQGADRPFVVAAPFLRWFR